MYKPAKYKSVPFYLASLLSNSKLCITLLFYPKIYILTFLCGFTHADIFDSLNFDDGKKKVIHSKRGNRLTKRFIY